MTTYHYKTSFSAAFQGAIDHLDIFRGTENCRSNRFGVTQILPPRLRCGIDGPRQLPFRWLCFLNRKGSRDEPPPGDKRTSGLASAWGTSSRKILALLVPGVRQLIFQMGQPLPSHDVALQASFLPGVPISNGTWNKTATTHRKKPSRMSISATSPFLETIWQQVPKEAPLAGFPSGFLPGCGWARLDVW